MKITCDNCKESFELKKLKQRSLGDEIQETYYNCPNCNKEYRVCITNKSIRELQNKIEQKKLIIRIETKKGCKNIKEVFELENLIKKHKKKMDKLNNRKRRVGSKQV
ncbi:hypothetical protein [Maledivibacter halophilus]|uniref:Uncharacterized protein n=1 Tax=Maledivibacter halophilus TaxID=36842 RepID=A0A1T5KF01_9FIRM|nr:hypothetical protein [Maledivibacter halophilus]SKC62220.1 hypothetical protein SAMN02194393_01744 [Maledivibacter halophilus]